MLRIPILAIAFALATGTAALSRRHSHLPPGGMTQGTDQERAACHPDVVRFCQAELKANENDVFVILSLQRNRPNDSGSCRDVLAATVSDASAT